MENVTDALYLAFAMMLLVLALAGAMNLFSKARLTSDIVIGAVESSESDDWYLTEGKSSKYREVGLETVIPSLYRYFKENLTIVFLYASQPPLTEIIDGKTYITGFTEVKPLPIYTTVTDDGDWTEYYKGNALTGVNPSYGFELNGRTLGKICVFDVEEENGRLEPFRSNRKENIDAIVEGKSGTYKEKYRGLDKTYNYTGNPLTQSNAKFIEVVYRENLDYLHGNKTTRKTVLTYIKIH